MRIEIVIGRACKCWRKKTRPLVVSADVTARVYVFFAESAASGVGCDMIVILPEPPIGAPAPPSRCMKDVIVACCLTCPVDDDPFLLQPPPPPPP